MAAPEMRVGIYRELADWHHQHGQPQLRDRFLVLAADAALSAGRADEAERLRHRLLRLTPHHMLRPFASFAEALGSPDVQGYVAELRRSYPPARAEQLLEQTRQPVANTPGAAPMIPATLPVFDLDAAAPRPVPSGEALKVYSLQDEEPPRSPSVPAPTWPRRTEAPRPAPPPRPVRRAVPVSPYLPPSERAAPVPAPAADADEAATGAWLSLALWAITLAAGLALAAWALAGPLLAEMSRR
jgi:hypothetical protein